MRPVEFMVQEQLRHALKGKKTLPRPLKRTHPMGAERYYKAKLEGFVDALYTAALRGLQPRYTGIVEAIARDDWGDDYEAIVIHLGDELRQVQFPGIPFGNVGPDAGPSSSNLPGVGNRERRRRAKIGVESVGDAVAASEAQVIGTTARMVNATNDAAWSAQLRHVLGVDVFAAEPWLRPTMKAFAVENASLIKGLREDVAKKVATTIFDGFQRGDSWRTVETALMDPKTGMRGISRRRAQLIAVDQVGKLNGELSRQRQMDLGITGYKWRGLLDNRERPEHVAREGKYFLWTQPPPDGHPGQPIRCRCDAEPDFTGLLEEYGEA